MSTSQNLAPRISTARALLSFGADPLPGSHLREAQLALGLAYDAALRGDVVAVEAELYDARLAAGAANVVHGLLAELDDLHAEATRISPPIPPLAVMRSWVVGGSR